MLLFLTKTSGIQQHTEWGDISGNNAIFIDVAAASMLYGTYFVDNHVHDCLWDHVSLGLVHYFQVRVYEVAYSLHLALELWVH